MTMYSDYLRSKSHDAIKFGYVEGYPCKIENSKGKNLKDYQISGNSIQHNKNLIPYPYYTSSPVTTNGITFTVSEDGIITANGTATANTYFYLAFNTAISPSKKYFLSGCPENGSSSTYNLHCVARSGSKELGYLTDVGTGKICDFSNFNAFDNINLRILILSGTTADNLVFKPQLELGTVGTDWVSQVPTFDNPIEIKSVGEKTINLLPSTFVTSGESTLNGISISEDNGIMNINGTASAATSIPITDGTTFTLDPGRYWLSGCPENGSSSTFQLYCNVLKYSSDHGSYTLVTSFTDTGTGVELDLTTLDYNGIVIGIGIENSATVSELEFKPMVQSYSGNEILGYEPPSKYRIPVVVHGKNFIPSAYYSNAISQSIVDLNGLTIRYNGDGTITFDGTATSATDIYLLTILQQNSILAVGTTYNLSGCPTGGSSTTFAIMWDHVVFETGSGITHQYTGDEGNLIIHIAEGYIANNLTFKPVLVVQDTEVNLIPSPILRIGKTINGVTFMDNGDGTITANGTATTELDFTLLATQSNYTVPQGNYTLLGCPSQAGATIDYYIWINASAGSSTVLRTQDIGSGNSFNLTGLNYERITAAIRIRSGVTVDNLVFRPQLLLNYEPNVNPIKFSERTVVSNWAFSNTSKRILTGNQIIQGYAASNYVRPVNVTISEVTDESISIVSQSNAYGVGIDFKVKPNTNYHVSGNSGNIGRIMVGLYDKDGNFLKTLNQIDNFTFTTPENAKWAVLALTATATIEGSVGSPITFSNVSIDYADYEEFKLPNLIPYPYNQATTTVNGITFTDNGNGTITVNGNATGNAYYYMSRINSKDFQVEGGKTYQMSWGHLGSSQTYYCFVKYDDKTVAASTDGRVVFTPSKAQYIDVGFVAIAGVPINNLVIKPQVVMLSPNTIDIYLNEPLRRVSSGQSDMIDFKNQKVIRNLSSTILNGTETWVLYSAYPEVIACNIANSELSSASRALISVGKVVPGRYNTEGFTGFTSWGGNGSALFYRKDDGGITVDEMKALLQNSPAELITVLKTPIEELVKLPKLPSLKGTTSYMIDSEVVPNNMKIKYIRM